MKNLLLIIFLCLSITTKAQKREKGDIEILLPIGFTDYSYSYDYDGTTNSVTSVSFGLIGDYYFNERWSFRSGALYQTMGGSFDIPPTIIGTQKSNYVRIPIIGEEKLDYLCVPVNLNWHFGANRNWNLNFGLTPSFLLSANGNYVEIGEVDLKHLVEPFQMGLSFGIGYKFPLSDNFSMLVDTQGFGGLTNILKNPGDEITNFGVWFDVGFIFTLK